MRAALILLLGCVGVFGQSYLSTMTWEPRNLVSKAGLVAYYDPGDATTLIVTNGLVYALSNKVFQCFGGTTNQTLFQSSTNSQPFYDTTNTLAGRSTIWFPASVATGYRALQSASFTLNQPTEILLSLIPVSWISTAFLFDGFDASHRGSVFQTGSTPSIDIFAGASFTFGNLPVGSWGTLDLNFTGAASRCRLNLGTEVQGDAGTSNMGGLTLGSRYDIISFCSNIRVAQMILCSQTNSPAEANYLRWGMLKQASLY